VQAEAQEVTTELLEQYFIFDLKWKNRKRWHVHLDGICSRNWPLDIVAVSTGGSYFVGQDTLVVVQGLMPGDELHPYTSALRGFPVKAHDRLPTFPKDLLPNLRVYKMQDSIYLQSIEISEKLPLEGTVVEKNTYRYPWTLEPISGRWYYW